ncbi:MAG: diadenosine tetraphosphate (Ap4A) HIT family hydrolase [Planctomycetota bacterium]|jgi:diadenosine tetraphosphate (Ap4A) HIT family hydrolase
MAESLNLDTQALNATMRKFGAPETCIRNYQHWSVMLRPAQVTLGSLVLAAFEPVTSFSELSSASFSEFGKVVKDLETSLKNAFAYDKINYLMLMMVDPDVHFHVIPRYAEVQYFADKEFVDTSWPGPANLGLANESDSSTNQQIVDYLSKNWNG